MDIREQMSKEGSKVTWQENGCFVCGESNDFGLHLEFDVDPATHVSRSKVVFDKKYQGWDNIVHGGILAAVLDDTMAYALMSLDTMGITTQLTVKYRKPVKVGETLHLEGSVEKVKSRLAYARAVGYVIENDDKIIKVEAEGSFYLDHPDHPDHPDQSAKGG